MTDESSAPRDPRPRPKYGEYATPQHQAEAIAGSLPPVSPLLVPRGPDKPVGDWAPPLASEQRSAQPRPAQTPSADARSAQAPSSQAPSSQAPSSHAPSAGKPSVQTPESPSPPIARASSARPSRRWDVVVSVGLLAYTLVTVLSGFATFSDLGALFDQIYAAQGIGDFSSDALADSIGVAVNIINVVIFTITLAITVRVLRARRLAFYIPLAGGALSIAVMLVLLGLVVFSDPAFVAYTSAAG